MKRSLIPIIGKGLSYTFGTGTESDLSTIDSSVSGLAENQEEIDSNIQAISRTVWQGNSYVEHVQLQLNMLSLGHLSPSIITPKKFQGFVIRNR